MAYDEDLANRIRELVLGEDGVSERRMFGGVSFLIDGNMSVSASGRGGLLVHVAHSDTDALVGKPHAHPLVRRGRPMQGWVWVEPEGVRTKRQLQRWVALASAHARTLPAKR